MGSIVVLDPSVLQNIVCVVENKAKVTENSTVSMEDYIICVCVFVCVCL